MLAYEILKNCFVNWEIFYQTYKIFYCRQKKLVTFLSPSVSVPNISGARCIGFYTKKKNSLNTVLLTPNSYLMFFLLLSPNVCIELLFICSLLPNMLLCPLFLFDVGVGQTTRKFWKK